jgi:hypothetical protein
MAMSFPNFLSWHFLAILFPSFPPPFLPLIFLPPFPSSILSFSFLCSHFLLPFFFPLTSYFPISPHSFISSLFPYFVLLLFIFISSFRRFPSFFHASLSYAYLLPSFLLVSFNSFLVSLYLGYRFRERWPMVSPIQSIAAWSGLPWASPEKRSVCTLCTSQ